MLKENEKNKILLVAIIILVATTAILSFQQSEARALAPSLKISVYDETTTTSTICVISNVTIVQSGDIVYESTVSPSYIVSSDGDLIVENSTFFMLYGVYGERENNEFFSRDISLRINREEVNNQEYIGGDLFYVRNLGNNYYSIALNETVALKIVNKDPFDNGGNLRFIGKYIFEYQEEVCE